MHTNQISMLLTAIQTALRSEDKERAVNLTNAGIKMCNCAESERIAVWRDIEKTAGWTGGFSNA